MKARILAQYYADAGQFITKEESRYALDTMRIEPHPTRGVVIIATDGHTMGVFHDLTGECPPEGITLQYIDSLAETCGDGRTLEINDDGSASLLRRTSEQVRFMAVESEGKFPNWRLPLPNWSRNVRRTDFNPEYIARCADASNASYPHLAVWTGTDKKHNENGPTVIVPYERDDCFFLVMPMRQTDNVCWPKLLAELRPNDDAATQAQTEPQETEVVTA